MCNCGAATETITHYLLRYRIYSVVRMELLDSVRKFDSTLQNYSEDQLLTVLLYGSEKYTSNVNKGILRLTISYLKVSDVLFKPFFDHQHLCLFISLIFLF